jgi:hypothetical protein
MVEICFFFCFVTTHIKLSFIGHSELCAYKHAEHKFYRNASLTYIFNSIGLLSRIDFCAILS